MWLWPETCEVKHETSASATEQLLLPVAPRAHCHGSTVNSFPAAAEDTEIFL